MSVCCVLPCGEIKIVCIVDLKWQNRLKVGRDKPELKVIARCSQQAYQTMMSGKTSWKTTFWDGGERCIQAGKMLRLPAGCSRSLGQQPRKHGNRRMIAWQNGTRRRLVPVERSYRLPWRLRTGTSGPIKDQGTAVHFREELWMSELHYMIIGLRRPIVAYCVYDMRYSCTTEKPT